MLQKLEKQRMQECVTACWGCRTECQITLYNHCLKKGGDHVTPDHIKIMADCIQICQTAADFMTRRSFMHAHICEACAAVCEACAKSCEDIGEAEMEHCAETCRECAAVCREMSAGNSHTHTNSTTDTQIHSA